jgi:HD-GYP domain-containing protein (c-di-GMP phosphodiesterase class II)
MSLGNSLHPTCGLGPFMPPSLMVQNPTLAELLEALSQALDITEGQPRGHAARTCLIAGRIARQLDLPQTSQDSLFYAALLKDAGCSTNSARIHKIFGGDDLLAKRNVKFVDWSNPIKSIGYAISNAAPEAPTLVRLKQLIGMIGPPTQVMDEVTAARCFRGADIAKQLGFGDEASDAIRHLDEHWDGKGSPTHISGEQIPLLSRILCLSQTFELFVTELGIDAGYEMLAQRQGRWFDPRLVTATSAIRDDEPFWKEHAAMVRGEANIQAPESAQAATEADVDEVCEAFASIVDAKSSYTAQHSWRVMKYSVALATVGVEAESERLTMLRRAALLHDIGKLGVSNSILDKPGRLTDAELYQVRIHPQYSYEILSCIRGFKRIAEVAANHHERLDGSGYWRGLAADDLDMDMRILAAADVFDALTAKRPYRDAMDPADAIKLMEKDSGVGLDATCVGALSEIGGELVSLR